MRELRAALGLFLVLVAMGIYPLPGIPVSAQQFVSPTLSPGQVQGMQVSTDTNGNIAGTWPVPFPTEPTVVIAAVYGQSSPFLCGIITKTAASFTGKCFALATSTLPSTATSLLGLTLSPFQNAAANIAVTVTGRQ